MTPETTGGATRTHEEIAWEAVSDYYGLDSDDRTSRSWLVFLDDAKLHALILAAIEEACDD